MHHRAETVGWLSIVQVRSLSSLFLVLNDRQKLLQPQ